MSCRAARKKAMALLDERRDPMTDEGIASHTSICAACRGEIRSMSLLTGIAARRSPTPPSPMAIRSKVMEEVALRKAPAMSRRPIWQPITGAAMALLAVLAVGVQLGAYMEGRTGAAPGVAELPAAPSASQTVASDHLGGGAPMVAVSEEPEPETVEPLVATEDDEPEPANDVTAPEPSPAAAPRASSGSSRAPIVPRGRSRVQNRRRPSNPAPSPAETQVVSGGTASPGPSPLLEMPTLSAPTPDWSRVELPGPAAPEDDGGVIIKVIPGQEL